MWADVGVLHQMAATNLPCHGSSSPLSSRDPHFPLFRIQYFKTYPRALRLLCARIVPLSHPIPGYREWPYVQRIVFCTLSEIQIVPSTRSSRIPAGTIKYIPKLAS